MKKRIAALTMGLLLLGTSGIVLASEEGTDTGGETSETGNDEVSEENHGYGYIASELDSNVPAYEVGQRTRAVIPAQYPTFPGMSSLDILEADYPEVRNQGSYDTCWAFSALGLAEFDLINDGEADAASIDLSELQLAYFTYNSVVDPLGGTAGDTTTYDNEKAPLDEAGNRITYLGYGGNYLMASQRLMQWCGAADEQTVPYSNAKSVLSNGLTDEYAYSKDTAHLQNVYELDIKNDASGVKNMIMDYGAVGAAYSNHQSNFRTLADGEQNYCDEDTNGFGHAVMIVGWDDSYAKENFSSSCQPENDGAWLVRNSWGEYYDYFWMSYETASLQDAVWVFDFETADNYDHNYQLDGGFFSATNPYYKTMANVFSVGEKDGVDYEELKAVSLSFTNTAEVTYTIEVYTDLTDLKNPSSGTKQEGATTQGTTTYAGVYTIDLEEAVKLTPGSDFAVVVTTDKYALECEMAYSYYAEDGSPDDPFWINNISENSDETKNGRTLYYGYGKYDTWVSANLCLKAYTDDVAKTPSSESKEETKEETEEETKEEPKEETKEETEEETKEDPKEETEEDPKEETKEDPEEDPKEETEEDTKEESKDEPAVDPEPEHKKTVEEGLYSLHSALKTTMTLDVSGASKSSGANVQLYTGNDTAAQDWIVRYLGDGQYTLMSACSGKYLAAESGSKNNGVNVLQATYTGGAIQKWYIDEVGSGFYRLVSVHSGLCLDVANGSSSNGTNIWLYTGNGTKAQSFSFENESKTVTEGYYRISVASSRSLTFDISGGSTANGANLQLWTKNGSAAQSMYITGNVHDGYTIGVCGTQRVLDVAGAGTACGTNVWQYQNNGSIAQKWYIKDYGDGTVGFISKCNGLYLDVQNGTLSSGSNIWCYYGNRSKAQKFDLETISVSRTVKDGWYTLSSALNTNLVLDVSGGSSANGANIQLWSANGTKAQKFYVKYMGMGLYEIGTSSGKCLDVASGSVSSGANVQQWVKNNTVAQRWYIIADANGGCRISSASSGHCLNVYQNKGQSGQNVNVSTRNNTKGQRFNLVI